MSTIREKIVEPSRAHFESHISKHVVNVELLLKHPSGIAEHPDIMDTVEKELEHIAEYHDKLEMLNKYF
jgi:hypothetical protein